MFIHDEQEWIDGWVSMSEICHERFSGDPGMDPNILNATDNLEYEEGIDWVDYATDDEVDPVTQEEIEEYERQSLRYDPPF